MPCLSSFKQLFKTRSEIRFKLSHFRRTTVQMQIRALYARAFLFRFLVEPVASTKPKFPMTENSRTYTVHCDRPLTLMCPAQAFPVPAFRYTKRRCYKKASAYYRETIFRLAHDGMAVRNNVEKTKKEIADGQIERRIHALRVLIFSFNLSMSVIRITIRQFPVIDYYTWNV